MQETGVKNGRVGGCRRGLQCRKGLRQGLKQSVGCKWMPEKLHFSKLGGFAFGVFALQQSVDCGWMPEDCV